MDDVAPHLREYRVQGIEQRFLRTDHKGQGAGLRATRAAGHGRIGHLHALFGRRSRHVTGRLRVDGAAIHGRNAFANPRQHPLFTQPHAAHVSGSGQHGYHQLRPLRGRLGRRADVPALGGEFRENVLVQVEQVQRVPGLDQVARHWRAHVAQSDKCDVHDAVLNED